jgi:NAD(P)-dependent dehydrogenase (short-subunit alcohol dehydrogenase family)
MTQYARREQEMTASLEGKVIAVTGAGKGLGRAYALYLAENGARLVVNNRRHAGEAASSADQVVEQIREKGGKAIAEYSEVEKDDSGQSLLDTALRTFGQLDALVANAGVAESTSFHKQSLDKLQRVIEINLAGTVNTIHPVFRYMYERGSGSLLLTTSVAGLYGEHGLPAYSASKAALIGLMHSLRSEGSGHGVRVNALAPYAATAMTQSALSEEQIERLKPGDLAPLVAWLVSDCCTLSGEILVAGAGRVSRARVRETASIAIPTTDPFSSDWNDQLWQQLGDEAIDLEYGGALEHFAGFTRRTPGPGN